MLLSLFLADGKATGNRSSSGNGGNSELQKKEMIAEINHSERAKAEEIRRVFQASYIVEARLLNASVNDFPPLKRTLEQFISSANTFFGFYEDDQLTAVIEIKKENQTVDIQSLVVDPLFFRRGIASKLPNFIFQTSGTNVFTVETGAANEPAITLYERHGFIRTNKWMTEIGIEKVAFEKTTN